MRALGHCIASGNGGGGGAIDSGFVHIESRGGSKPQFNHLCAPRLRGTSDRILLRSSPSILAAPWWLPPRPPSPHPIWPPLFLASLLTDSWCLGMQGSALRCG
jgi:hypothetical protein